jgi:AraC family transcriptional regulator
MEPKIVIRPAFTVIGILYHGKNEHQEIPRLWGQFNPRSAEIESAVADDICYGIADNFDRVLGTFDYLAGLEVADDAQPPPGMVRWQVPQQTYAVFPCTLPTLMRTFQTAYDVWMPMAGYHRVPGQEFELYGEEFNPGDPQSPMFVYIPVESVQRVYPVEAVGE